MGKYNILVVILLVMTPLINAGVSLTINSNGEFDINEYPYPFENNAFDEIRVQHTLEHVYDVKDSLNEIHRIGKPNATIIIEVPHALSLIQIASFDHRNNFILSSFSQGKLDYFQLDFELVETKLIYKHWWKRFIPLKIKKLFNGLFDEVRFKLRVIK